MNDEQALAALLGQAGAAHGAYEETELGGVYDQNWPTWYATYLLQHGVETMLQVSLSVEQLRALLRQCDEAYKRMDRDESWPLFYARLLRQTVHTRGQAGL